MLSEESSCWKKAALHSSRQTILPTQRRRRLLPLRPQIPIPKSQINNKIPTSKMEEGTKPQHLIDKLTIKAMRGRLALQKHCVRNASRLSLCFAEALGVRARPRAAFV